MQNFTPIDITNIPALRRIVAEMKHAKQPRLLKQDSETVALLLPLETVREQDIQTLWKNYHPKKVQAAIQQSAGALTGVNREQLLADIADARTQESRRRAA